MVGMTTDNLDLKTSFFGKKTAILAQSGYGKSYTARVIIEEGLKKGITFVIVDPQQAYLNLPDFDYIDIQKVKSARKLGILIANSNKNIVLMTKGLGIQAQNRFMFAFLDEYRKNIEKGIHTIIIDEAHKFAPEGQKTSAKDQIRGMFQENRSDGLGCIAISQRVARLDKTVISQCDNIACGRVTSLADKGAVKGYVVTDESDVEKISKLKQGEFYLNGFGLEEPEIKIIRKSETEHSGNSPENLLTENTEVYNKYIRTIVKGDRKMDKIDTKNEIIKKVIPSMDGMGDLILLGAKVSMGAMIGGAAGIFIGSRIKLPIPVLSGATIAGAGTTIGLYAGYRFMPESMAVSKDILKYSASGSAVFTFGSLAFDVLNAMNVRLPNFLNFAVAAATGAGAEPEASADAPDTNTQFA